MRTWFFFVRSAWRRRLPNEPRRAAGCSRLCGGGENFERSASALVVASIFPADHRLSLLVAHRRLSNAYKKRRRRRDCRARARRSIVIVDVRAHFY